MPIAGYLMNDTSSTENLIIFFIPEKKLVNGGIISIFSLCKESRRYFAIHKSSVIICTYPGGKTYSKNDLFNNDEKIFSFEEVMIKYPSLKRLIIHIPEYITTEIYPRLISQMDYLSKVGHIQINILNQNIQMMPPLSTIASLYAITKYITQTTAHIRYCTQEIADYYCIPTHLMSVAIDKKNYMHLEFSKKKNQIVISPDYHPKKKQVISRIKRELSSYEIIEVSGMKYEEYKKLIAESKFTITFGEGFDGYYIESIFSNTLAFAVYNEDFFPSEDYLNLDNIYKSYKSFSEEIVKTIKKNDSSAQYEKTVSDNCIKLEKIYDHNRYLKNIKQFYQSKYTYVPGEDSIINFLNNVTIESNKANFENINKINELQLSLAESEELSRLKSANISDMLNSRSWKITRPLRVMSQGIKEFKL